MLKLLIVRSNAHSREIGETSTESGEPSDYEGSPVKMKTIAIE
jgi:hypothetical protein